VVVRPALLPELLELTIPKIKNLPRRHKDDGSTGTDGTNQAAVCAALLELKLFPSGTAKTEQIPPRAAGHHKPPHRYLT